MNLRNDIELLSDLEIGLVIGGNDGGDDSTTQEPAPPPRDVCLPWDWWNCGGSD